MTTRDEGTRKATLRGRLVEGVRLIFIPVLGAAGYQIGASLEHTTGTKALLYVFLGAAVGYVLGGILGRLTLRAVKGIENELRRTPAAEIAGGVVGLLLGLVVAALLMLPLLFLPAAAAWPSILFIYLSLGSLGIRFGRARYEDIFALVGMKPRASANARGDLHVLDTSALIDGRVVDLVATGFLTGTVLLHEGVLRELQAISDTSDPQRRARGRRGLDVLVELQKMPTIQFQLVDEAGVLDVDAALVRLARERGASLVTVDHNLAKVAEALRVPVAQINSLASRFRVPYAAGDEVAVRLVREGREHGQAVGYLDDGTMVVVERATERIGSQVEARVRNVIQTTTGRMIFASLEGLEPATSPPT
ncbi:MAG TPA: PIN domain nuclease [Actinomycetota bacterium]|nr:PIN domain nuclease [Actinomycetota bacterium]